LDRGQLNLFLFIYSPLGKIRENTGHPYPVAPCFDVYKFLVVDSYGLEYKKLKYFFLRKMTA
jgi:hypothetical protein